METKWPRGARMAWDEPLGAYEPASQCGSQDHLEMNVSGPHFWHRPKKEGKKDPASHFQLNQLKKVRAWSWCVSVPAG